MKTYKSKREIHNDFQVAVKFRLKYDVPRSAYDEFFDALREHYGWKITEFNSEVHHLNTHYPISVGLFVDIPIEDESGRAIGVRYVLLEHESGPEIFVSLSPLQLLVAGYVGGKIIDGVVDAITSKAVTAFKKAIRLHWPTRSMRSESPIWYVEIRTADKGRMRIKFEDFEPTQLTCLVRQYSDLAHISECNSTCFGGLLFESDEAVNDDGI